MKIKRQSSAGSKKNKNQTRTNIFWVVGITAATLLVILVSYKLSPVFDYNRWDNFEQITSTLLETHRQWLRGILPLWNPHQHMGEPLLATAIPAVLYFPYTILAGIMSYYGISDSHFCILVIVTHLPLMAMGFYLLARASGVRPCLAWLSSISITFSGYFTAVSTVWIFLVPILTWLPFALLGAIILTERETAIRGMILLVVSLTMLVYAGHPQFSTYAGLTVALFCSVNILFKRNFRTIPLLLISLVSAVLLSAPTLVAVIKFLPYTSRGISFSKEAFVSNGAITQALWGLISPGYAVDNGFIISGASIMFYGGAWPLPALVLGAVVLFFKRVGMNDEDRELGPGFIAFLIGGIVLLLFSLGKWGGIYGLTYGIPVWSSFRWPHKFIPFAMVMLGLAAAIGLEAYLRNHALISWRLRIIIACLLLTAALVGLGTKGLALNLSAFAVILFITSILMFFFTLWSHNKWSLSLLILSMFVSAIGLVTISQSLGLKRYSETYASIGKKELGISKDYRVLPLSQQRWYPDSTSAMQEHGLFQSATINNYYSLTGCSFDLIPELFLRYLPSNIEGLLPPASYPVLLSGPFLSSLNVRYYIVAREDAGLAYSLDKSPHYRRLKKLSRVYVYERGDAMRRAFFATQTITFKKEKFWSWIASNDEKPDKAFVRGLSDKTWPDNAAVREVKDDSGIVEVNVNAPEGGFLVLAYTWYPTWRAFVDGVETKIYRVNGLIQGIMIPKGAKHIELRWSARNLMTGLGLMIVGILVFMVAILYTFRLRKNTVDGRDAAPHGDA